MYLNYDEYIAMGGTLDSSAFFVSERKARYMINAQAGGQTGERIGKLPMLPETIKDCMYDLILVISEHLSGDKQISSESQSQGGSSESYSYVIKTDKEVAEKCDSVIEQYFYGGGLGYLLYRGASL